MKKDEILQIIKDKIIDKIQNFEKLIAEIRTSNTETKSSMGDKYETGREILQQEINNIQRQLNETLKQQIVIQRIDNKATSKVQNGAIVKTNKGIFFISISLGEIIYKNQKITTISQESPLTKAMSGLTKGESFSINNTKQCIEQIW